MRVQPLRGLQLFIAVSHASVVTLITFTTLATHNASERTACLRSSQIVEQCPARSWWENILVRFIE